MRGWEKMLFILLTVICTFPGIHVGAQQLAVVNNGSKVEFSVDNGKGIGEKIKGKFSNLSGNIIFDPQHLASASFDVTLNAATANTGDKFYDFKLKTEHFLNTSLFPTIRLRSLAVKQVKSGIQLYELTGTLTLKGVSKPVSMQFTATPLGTGYLFRGLLHLNRLDYAVGSTGEMGKEVIVFIEVRAAKK